MAVTQNLDAFVADHLAQLALGHPVMLGDLLQSQRRIAGAGKDEAKGCGGSHLHSPMVEPPRDLPV